MKRTVFLVDKSKKLQVEKYLNDNGITFSYNDRFYFDIRTAIATVIGGGILIVIFSQLAKLLS